MTYLEMPLPGTRMSLFGTQVDSARQIHVPESPDVARHIVDQITKSDALVFQPPLVDIRRVAPGHFRGSVPGMGVEADIEVQPDPRGRGSVVIEHTHAKSLVPGLAFMASAVHSTAASLGDGYARAELRYTQGR